MFDLSSFSDHHSVQRQKSRLRVAHARPQDIRPLRSATQGNASTVPPEEKVRQIWYVLLIILTPGVSRVGPKLGQHGPKGTILKLVKINYV